MRRSGAFTLAVVLTLGAVTGGRGQELSSSVTAANGSLDGFVLPSVPENWADLPFKLTASQTVSYNSNISSFPVDVAPRGAIVGDFFFRQGEPGIGRLIDDYRARLQSEQLFAAVALSSLLGLTVFWAFGLLGQVMVGSWHESHRSAE